jgi:SAM-dependent methyltransferase
MRISVMESIGAARVESENAAVEHLSGWIASNDRGTGPTSILDAGCGQRCVLEYGPEAVVTGLDVSPTLLERNTRLNHRIVADLAHAPLEEGQFDLVVCWDVLEHLDDPTSALDNMSRALAPRGLLVLKAPSLNSPKGLLTKFTPYRFHLWAYRRFDVAGDATPFPTPLKRTMSPRALWQWASSNGLSVRWAACWEAQLQVRLRSRLHLAGRPWAIAQRLVRALSLGTLDSQATDFVIVLQK